MNREIKFRAWDGRTMFDVAQITFADAGWHVSRGRGVCIPAQPHITLMQFTGMIDRQGKEIYEGDVVLLWDEPERSQVIDNLQQAHALMSECILCDSCRVIGNIYENPELVKS